MWFKLSWLLFQKSWWWSHRLLPDAAVHKRSAKTGRVARHWCVNMGDRTGIRLLLWSLVGCLHAAECTGTQCHVSESSGDNLWTVAVCCLLVWWVLSLWNDCLALLIGFSSAWSTQVEYVNGIDWRPLLVA